MNFDSRRFYRVNSLVILNESGSGSSLLYSIAEVLETTSEHAVVQMFSFVDNITWLRTEQRKTVPLSKIIVNNINMIKKIHFSVIFHQSLYGENIVSCRIARMKNVNLTLTTDFFDLEFFMSSHFIKQRNQALQKLNPAFSWNNPEAFHSLWLCYIEDYVVEDSDCFLLSEILEVMKLE